MQSASRATSAGHWRTTVSEPRVADGFRRASSGFFSEQEALVTARIEQVHPVLMARDVEQSIAFYQSMGFRCTFIDRAVQPTYAAVTRDAVTLHLQVQHEPYADDSRDRPNYRFVCSDVDELYDAFVSGGAVSRDDPGPSPWARPENTPWGTREFHVRDPDGNGLHFYRAI
jgi:catechol 2,3-dioxygenase-like lactoylglutathione lyase family enzyme